jgi:hypothetical protein
MVVLIFNGHPTNDSQAPLSDRNVAILSAHDALLAVGGLGSSWLGLVRDARLRICIASTLSQHLCRWYSLQYHRSPLLRLLDLSVDSSIPSSHQLQVCIRGEATWRSGVPGQLGLYEISSLLLERYKYHSYSLAAGGFIHIGVNGEAACLLAGKRRSCFLKHEANSSSFSHIFAESSSRRCMSDRPLSSSFVLA